MICHTESNPEHHGEQRRGRTRGWWRPVFVLALVVGVTVGAWIWRLDRELLDLREWIGGLGVAAPAVFVLIRAASAVALIPGSALSAAAGALFGPVTAVIVVSAGKTLGACVSFLIARYFAREAVARWLAGQARYQRLDRLVGRHSALVVALMRLVPVIPFNVQNYGFGLTPVRFTTYLFWSWLCMLPGAVLVVVGMEIVLRTLASGRVPWVLVAVLAGSVLIMAGLAVYTLLRLRAARRADTSSESPAAGRSEGRQKSHP